VQQTEQPQQTMLRIDMIKKTRCNNTWTENKYNCFIKSILRRASGRWAPKQTCKKNSRVARNKYKCAICNNIVGNKDIKVDHKNPVVSVQDGFINWDVYIKRLFVEQHMLQAICKKCHDIKTSIENKQRKTNAKYKVDDSYTKAVDNIQHTR